MSRRTIEVSKAMLVKAIAQVEKDGGIDGGVVALHKLVATVYNGMKVPEQVSFSVVGLRIAQWKLAIKTQPARRGGDGSQLRRTSKGPRRTKKQKFAKNDGIQNSLVQIRLTTQNAMVGYGGNKHRFDSLIDAIENGSRSAAVKLNCLQCCGYVTAEVRNCTGYECPMWPFRPYQGDLEAEEDGESDAEATDDDSDD